jgi:hypothetical protein
MTPIIPYNAPEEPADTLLMPTQTHNTINIDNRKNAGLEIINVKPIWTEQRCKDISTNSRNKVHQGRPPKARQHFNVSTHFELQSHKDTKNEFKKKASPNT